MTFRNPLTSVDASQITGQIQGSQLAADSIDGKLITGAHIRTAATGQRVEIVPGGFEELQFWTGAANEDAPASISGQQAVQVDGNGNPIATSSQRLELISGLATAAADESLIYLYSRDPAAPAVPAIEMYGGVRVDTLTVDALGAALPDAVAATTIPASTANGWSAHATFVPRARVSADGRVWLEGWLTAGTTTGGTVVATLPAGIPAPPVARYFVCAVMASQTAAAGTIDVQITNGGSIVLRGTWPTGGTELALDEIGFYPA